MKKYRGWSKAGWLMAVTLPMALTNAFAVEAAKPAMGKVEQSYQAGDSSPVGQTEMHQNINPKAPPMTKEEFDKARNIYLDVYKRQFRDRRGRPAIPDRLPPKGESRASQ